MTRNEHLLTCVIEECAEIQQAAAKALRFGLENGHPSSCTTNADDIAHEVCDLTAVLDLLKDAGAITYDKPQATVAIARKKETVEKYIDYAKSIGTIQ